MKFYLLIFLFALFVFISVFIYYYFLVRHKLYKDLVYMCKYLKNNISFNKNDLNTLINESVSEISYSSKFIIKNYDKQYLKILRKEDIKNLSGFIGSLGKGDVTYECNNISFYENTFNDLEKSTKEDVSKKAMMYLKLTIGLGLIICVLLI